MLLTVPKVIYPKAVPIIPSEASRLSRIYGTDCQLLGVYLFPSSPPQNYIFSSAFSYILSLALTVCTV